MRRCARTLSALLGMWLAQPGCMAGAAYRGDFMAESPVMDPVQIVDQEVIPDRRDRSESTLELDGKQLA